MSNSCLKMLLNLIKKIKWHLIALSITIFLIAIIQALAMYSGQIALGKPIVKNFEEISTGVFRAYGDGFHEIAIPITMVANKTYGVKYKLNESATNIVTLTSDLIGPNYDSINQDENKVINQNSVGREITYKKTSDNSPGSVLLRFFYTGNPGLTISNITISYSLENYITYIPFILLFIGYMILYHKIIIRYFNNLDNNNWKIIVSIIFISLTIIRFCLYLRTPFLTGDEYVYKSISTWIFNKNSINGLNPEVLATHGNINNLIFPYIGSTFLYFGEYFYVAVKLYNTICISISAYIIYLIATKLSNRKIALMSGVAVLLIPFNAIGSFFLTEPTFFLALTITFYLFLKIEDNSVHQAIFIGIFTFFLSIIRPNGFILIIAYFLYLLLLSSVNYLKKLGFFITSLLIYIVAFYIFKQIFIDKDDSDIYGLIFKNIEYYEIIKIFNKDFFNLLFGHIFSISYIYAFPLLIIGLFIARNQNLDSIKLKIYRLSFSLFIAGLAVSVIFTIIVSKVDIGGLGRWHVRYYYYTFPFIILCFFISEINNKLISKNFLIFYLSAVLLLIIFGLNSSFVNNIWFSSSLDNIDNQWIISLNYSNYILVTLFLIIYFLIIYSNCFNNVKNYYFLYIVIIMSLGNYGTTKILNNIDQVTQSVNRTQGLPYNFLSTQCGVLARNYLGAYPGSYIVIGSDKLSIESVNFWLNSIPIKTVIVNSGSVASNLNEDFFNTARYLIINGDIETGKYIEKLSVGKCRVLARY